MHLNQTSELARVSGEPDYKYVNAQWQVWFGDAPFPCFCKMRKADQLDGSMQTQ